MIARPWFKYVRRVLPFAVVTALPLTLTYRLWKDVWSGARPLAWDGSGHYALARIYDQTIFPDTFGWTQAYFGGMPFPNFYPPLFYWCVGLLSHTRLFSFNSSFKIVLVLPVLLLPLAVGALAWAVSGRNRAVAIGAACACLPLLLDYRLRFVLLPSGIDYVSTFQVGLYTQPLGFILLVAWFIVYIEPRRRAYQFALASVLLALTVLANFFNAITAIIFITMTVAGDLLTYFGAVESRERKKVARAVVMHVASPPLAMVLTLFWVAPMLNDYHYLVTRPDTISIFEYLPTAMWGWYALAAVGFLLWLRRPTRMMFPFLAICVAMESAVIFTTEIAPRWFPLQPLRFLSMLNYLLAVPVGQIALSLKDDLPLILRKMFSRNARLSNLFNSMGRLRPITPLLGICLLILAAFMFIETPLYSRTFSLADDEERINAVLDFASQHRDGRYLVEHSIYTYPGSASDVRAITSYLGAQGNEAVSVVFREAAPNAIFFNPLVGSLSTFSDVYGLTSVLADDLDFFEQPLRRHLERARFIGVKYLVVAQPRIKDQLAQESIVGARHDLGLWSVFELAEDQPPRARALPYRPALVVSSLMLKQRRRNEYDFIRLAEEQFASGWFDVMLVRSNEMSIDKLQELNQFGALILHTYECDDENRAFELLRDFARQRPLILLSSNAPLLRRIRASIAEFPFATIIERSPETSDDWLEAEGPTFRYNSSSIRKEWEEIRLILDRQKIAVAAASDAALSSEVKQETIDIRINETLPESIPILIGTTYNPNWRRSDGRPVYATTPFFMMTFAQQPTHLLFARPLVAKISMLTSALAFVSLCGFAFISRYRASTRLRANEGDATARN